MFNKSSGVSSAFSDVVIPPTSTSYDTTKNAQQSYPWFLLRLNGILQTQKHSSQLIHTTWPVFPGISLPSEGYKDSYTSLSTVESHAGTMLIVQSVSLTATKLFCTLRTTFQFTDRMKEIHWSFEEELYYSVTRNSDVFVQYQRKAPWINIKIGA